MSIPEDRALNVPFPDRLSGSDADLFSPNNIFNYRFRSGSPGLDYFGVNAETGEVFVKTDLRAQSITVYNVSHFVSFK